MDKLTLSQALNGYEIATQARHLSIHTLEDYRNTFRRLQKYLGGDPIFETITQVQLEEFLGSLKFKKKTILNYHTGLSALWQWATQAKIVPENILHSVERPKPEKPDIIPLTENDVRLMLAATERSKGYITHGVKTSHSISHSLRNRAIILLMVDTGLRASELCALKVRDVDLRTGGKMVRVIEGKGFKSRHIPISARTAQAIWKYLNTRKDAKISDPLFTSRYDYPMERRNLYDIVSTLGDRAGIQDCHPHLLRHTFAITFLRNGGNIYALQQILGHESLETCQKYLRIAQTDIDLAHRQASPVDHWQL